MNTLNKKVILTGATGLIGAQAVQPLLDDGFDVYAIGIEDMPINLPSGDKNLHYIKANLFDESTIEKLMAEIKASYLLHFAWITTEDYLSSNVNFDLLTASLTLLKYFKENNGKRAVFSGTCFEYDLTNINGPIDEAHTVKPAHLYGKVKNHLNKLAVTYCEHNNISFAWGRIFYVYGKNEHPKRLTASVIKALKNNEPVIIKSGPLTRDYMYNKDIAAAFVKLLASSVCGDLNISTNNPLTIKEFVTAIAQPLKKTELLVFKDDYQGQPKYVLGDNKRLIEEVGFSPKYSLKEAVKELLS